MLTPIQRLRFWLYDRRCAIAAHAREAWEGLRFWWAFTAYPALQERIARRFAPDVWKSLQDWRVRADTCRERSDHFQELYQTMLTTNNHLLEQLRSCRSSAQPGDPDGNSNSTGPGTN